MIQLHLGVMRVRIASGLGERAFPSTSAGPVSTMAPSRQHGFAPRIG
jgi:hypothetical protein